MNQNRSSQSVGFFGGQCYICDKFGHRSTKCRSQIMMNIFNTGRRFHSFQGYYYTCNIFGHKANQCRTKMSTNSLDQRFVVCHSCNKPGHISKLCKSKVGKKLNPKQKNKLINKANLEEVRREMEKI